MQRGSGMVHWHDDAPAEGTRLAVNARDALVREPLGHRIAPERHNHERIERFDLRVQIWLAGGDLVGQRITIAGRAALDDVGDKYLLASQTDSRQHLIQEFAGRADEWEPLFIFVPAR